MPAAEVPATEVPATDMPAAEVPAAEVPAADVTVNGATERFPAATTVDQVVLRLCDSADGIAVARNGEVVPRSAWPVTAVEAGDRLEILTAAAGG